MTSMHAVLTELQGEHREVRVYIGPDEEHRAYAGFLRMRDHEAQDFAARINTLVMGSREFEQKELGE